MADFGIGVGMYFKFVRFFGIVTFIAGCLSLPVMNYYKTSFNNFKVPHDEGEKSFLARLDDYSATCIDTSFQPCPSCKIDNAMLEYQNRLYVDDSGLPFILVNNCKISNVVGLFSYVTMIFVICAVYYFVYVQSKDRIELDEGEQTSSDYSIQIQYPPDTEEAKDPATWKAFFEERFPDVHVSVCTVAIKNEDLVELLEKKYKLQNEIRDMLPIDIKFDDSKLEEIVELCPPPSSLKSMLCRAKPAETFLEEINEINAEMDKLLKGENGEGANFGISHVFISFETEHMQRAVLEKMQVPKSLYHTIDDSLKFEGTVLRVMEPDEPSSIRWNDLYEREWERQLKSMKSFTLAFVLIILTSYLIRYATFHSATYSSITIILCNRVAPIIVKKLTNMESHQTETSFASSEYIKVTLFRWVNTAIVAFIVSPFTDTIHDEDFIMSLRILFTIELIQRPVIQLLNLKGLIKTQILAPRAPDQRRMNLLMKPSDYSVGERYTDVTKLLFLTFFYCTIFPPGFFFASAILCIYYWVDKYCILRVWKQAPKINADISKFSIYFLWATLLAYSFMSAYLYSGFPFDNACLTDEEVPDDYFGKTFKAPIRNEYTARTFNVTSDDKVYEYCNQDLVHVTSKVYNWMSVSQEHYFVIYGTTFSIVLFLVVASIAIRLKHRFESEKIFTPDGEASDETFSSVHEIYGYVPQLNLEEFLYPILLCDVSNIDKSLIDWTGDYDAFNVIFDVPEEYRKSSFSAIEHWRYEDVDN